MINQELGRTWLSSKRTAMPSWLARKMIWLPSVMRAATSSSPWSIPMDQQKFIVVDAATYSTWRQIPRFSEFQNSGEAGLRALVDGSIGKIKDFFVFRSQFVQKTGTTTVTTHNMAFAKDAIGLVIRRLPQPLPGTGAIAEYAELGNFGMRVVLATESVPDHDK